MRKSILALGLGFALAPSMASAESLLTPENFPGTLGANVALTSEYIFRGISQTDDVPAIQGGVDYSHDIGVYASIWASNVKFADAVLELDYIVGFGKEIDKFSFDVNATYFTYPGAARSLNFDFFEITGGVGYDFDYFAVGASVSFSPDYFGGSDEAVYTKLSIDVPLGKYFTFGGHVGYQMIDDNAAWGTDDYVDYLVGVSTEVLGFDLTLAWTDTDLPSSQCDDLCGQATLTVSRSF
jgi:uncharacterized protein (TIGR02001 family)